MSSKEINQLMKELNLPRWWFDRANHGYCFWGCRNEDPHLDINAENVSFCLIFEANFILGQDPSSSKVLPLSRDLEFEELGKVHITSSQLFI